MPDYQNAIYNAARIPNTMTAPIANVPCGLNIVASISRPFGLFLLRGSARLITIIRKAQIRNTKPILSRKGISYKPDSLLREENPVLLRKDRSISRGKLLKRRERGKVMIAVTSAAVAVVRFQKKPRLKIAKMPGDTNPVYSWIN